jgi:hypothetical protein
MLTHTRAEHASMQERLSARVMTTVCLSVGYGSVSYNLAEVDKLMLTRPALDWLPWQ